MVVSTENSTLKHCNLSRGLFGYKIPSFSGQEEMIKKLAQTFKDTENLSAGDKVVAVYGKIEGEPGSSNVVQVVFIE